MFSKTPTTTHVHHFTIAWERVDPGPLLLRYDGLEYPAADGLLISAVGFCGWRPYLVTWVSPNVQKGYLPSTGNASYQVPRQKVNLQGTSATNQDRDGHLWLFCRIAAKGTRQQVYVCGGKISPGTGELAPQLCPTSSVFCPVGFSALLVQSSV